VRPERVMDETLAAYLRALAGEAPDSAYLEIRYRVASNTPAHDLRALIASINDRAATADVDVGCAPRLRLSGTKKDVADVWVLWAQCDGAAGAAAAVAVSPAPSIVVGSGSGPNVHAYWPLRRPLSPRDAEHANLRLANAIGADRACYGAARILDRLAPGATSAVRRLVSRRCGWKRTSRSTQLKYSHARPRSIHERIGIRAPSRSTTAWSSGSPVSCS
jgi:hypothetical protein